MSTVKIHQSTESILVKGLDGMTKACDVLTAQNHMLNKDIEGLKHKIGRLQEKLLVNREATE